MDLPYIKNEGINVLFSNPRLALVIEEIVINGNEKYNGEKIFFWAGADEAYDARFINVDPVIIPTSLSIRWSIEHENGERCLFFSSLIEQKPIYYKIKENTKTIKIRYHIRYPDRTSSDSYEKTFNLEWKLPEKDYSLVLEVYLFMYKKGEYIGNKILGESNISITDNTDDLLYFLDNIYKNLTEEERIELTDSYNEMVSVLEKKTLYKQGDRFRFNNGVSGKSFFMVLIFR